MSRDNFERGWFYYALARLQKKTRLSALKRSTIHKTSVVEAGSQIVDSIFDRHSYCGYDCVILNSSVGSFCSIADSVYIGGTGHPTHFVSTSPVFLSHKDSVKTKYSNHEYYDLPKTEIGHDVWIGHGAKIKAGVRVGTGAVVGMGSVVTKNVEPYAVVAGNPAREISKRFPDQIIIALLRSEWWNFDDEHMRKVAENFHSPEIFLKKENLI